MTRQWGRVLVTSNIQTLLLRALLAVLAICLAGRVVKDTHATTLSPMEKVASPPFPISTDCEKQLLRDVQSDAFTYFGPTHSQQDPMPSLYAGLRLILRLLSWLTQEAFSFSVPAL